MSTQKLENISLNVSKNTLLFKNIFCVFYEWWDWRVKNASESKLITAHS